MLSERLIYNHYTFSDFKDYYKLVSNIEVMKMVTGRPDKEKEARERFENMLNDNVKNPAVGRFKVTLRSNASYLGHAKLEMTEKNEAEIGYLLMPEFWGKGYGSEIAQAMVNLGKQMEEIQNLIAIIDPENEASKKILEKQGFKWDYDRDYIGLPAAYYKLKV
ncbi:GNAT family N-acetyltransferase [Aequorivita sediminis]|uniref:GNAT family N-acetyltransferase n=1 Tax=Aequorivita sediminis TaxID=3073653 RepID=UPI0028AA1EB6|nr:GNAT family N-acetyltransferase [Aequorivita sp. F6058]